MIDAHVAPSDPGILFRTAYVRETDSGRQQIRYVESVGVGVTDDEDHPFHGRAAVRHRVIYPGSLKLSETRVQTYDKFVGWLNRYGAAVDPDWTNWAREELANAREAA